MSNHYDDFFAPIRALIEAQAQDVHIMVVSDSTGTQVASGVDSWPRRFTERLAHIYRLHTVLFRIIPDSLTPVWEPEEVVSVGQGPRTITMWLAAENGWNLDNFIGDSPAGAQALLFPLGNTVDAVLFSMGHNEPDGAGFQARLEATTTLIKNDSPSVSVFAVNQNPRLSLNVVHQVKHQALTDFARDNGYPQIRSYQKFARYKGGDYSSLMIDDAHPNEQGQRFWANQIWDVWQKGESVFGGVFSDTEVLLRGSEYQGQGFWYDESYNGHDMTMVDVEYDGSTEFVMNGSSAYMKATAHPAFDFGATDSFTLMFVGSVDSVQNGIAGLLNTQTGTGTSVPGFIMYSGSGRNLLFRATDTTQIQVVKTGAIVPNNDDLVVFTAVRRVSDTRIIVYVDGVQDGSHANDGTTAGFESGRDLYLGAVTANSFHFKGSIVGAAVWARDLSEAEILEAGNRLLPPISDTRPFCGACGWTVNPPLFPDKNEDLVCDACGANLKRFGFRLAK